MELTYTADWEVSTRFSSTGVQYVEHTLDIADYNATIVVRDNTTTRWQVLFDNCTILSSPDYYLLASRVAWQPRTDIGALRLLCMNAIVEHHRETHQP